MVEVVKTNELIRDADFHARQGKLDPMHVQRLLDTLEFTQGALDSFPPIIACRRRKIVVEGWHRIEASNKYHGADEATIRVDWREYEDEASLFMDALSYSADSKLPLSYHNQQSCVLRAEALGIMPEKVAGLLKVPEGKLAKRVVTGAVRRDGNIVALPLKAPFRHMAGQELSEDQRVVNERSDGRSVRWHADQITARISKDMLPWQDTAMIRSLKTLREALINEFRIDEPPAPPEEKTGTDA